MQDYCSRKTGAGAAIAWADQAHNPEKLCKLLDSDLEGLLDEVAQKEYDCTASQLIKMGELKQADIGGFS